MSSRDFYKNIEPMSDMYTLIRSDKFKPVPPDWDVIVTDIRKSTEAIQAGTGTISAYGGRESG